MGISKNIMDEKMLSPQHKKVLNPKLDLLGGNSIILNEEQIGAIDKIYRWLMDNNSENYFTLSGYAGTGKTTCIKRIVEYYKKKVVVSAPTHKAKRVITDITKVRGKTLQSLLGLRPDINLDDFNPNDPQFNPIVTPKIGNYSLVIIDEASMINSDLFSLIKKLVSGLSTKIIFMGDPAQIPPIGENESVIFFDKTIKKYELFKIERQNKDNPLMKVSFLIRNNLLSINGSFKRITKINGSDEGVIFTHDIEEFKKMLLNKFKSEEFKKDINYCRIIAWKNKTVKQSNNFIRQNLFNKPKETVIRGDVLMGYRTIMDEKMGEIIIENSCDYKVIYCSPLKQNEFDLYGYDVKLKEKNIRGDSKITEVFIIETNDSDNLHNYAEKHDDFKNRAKKDKSLWKLYYKFRRSSILMKTIDKYRNNEIRSSGEIIVKDIDYGFAITAHKSQGSTYTHVFVIERDMNDNILIKERNQIKYVALTRPQKSATVLTSKELMPHEEI